MNFDYFELAVALARSAEGLPPRERSREEMLAAGFDETTFGSAALRLVKKDGQA